MANDETGQLRAGDAIIKRFRSDLLPPAPPPPMPQPQPIPIQPVKNEPGAFRLMLLGAGGCLAALGGALLAGIIAPVLIPAALMFLFLGFIAPDVVRWASTRWPFSLIPTSYTRDPRRFAATLALVVIPISGIAGLGVYRGVLFDSGNDSNVPPPVAALAVVPTASATAAPPTPTETPVTPTATPTPATPTPSQVAPSPTATQQASPATTPVPPASSPAPAQMTDAQQAYLDDLFSKWRIIDNSDDSFNQLNSQLRADSSLISNPEWQKQMVSQLAIWQSTYEAAKNGTAPRGLEIINGKWIDFLGHKNLSADELTRGIKQLDVKLINQGETELDTANDLYWKLDGLLVDFLAQYDETPGVYSS
jgi:hypothetical protein